MSATVNEFEARVLAEAVYFTAFLRKGREFVTKSEHPTRGEAEAAAQAMADEHRRGAMVYAVNAAGRSAHLCNLNPRKG